MKRANLAIVTICTLSAGCVPPAQYDSEFEAQFSHKSRSVSFASGYFPESFGHPSVDNCGPDAGERPLIGEVEETWFPEQWIAAREPSFFLLSEQDAPPRFALRFSYIPSFSPSIFLRVHENEDTYTLVAKRMNGAGGYEPGSIASSKMIRLSDDEVADLKKLLTEDGLFAEKADNCSFGFDGSEWLFEQIDHQGYRLVKRWSPTEGAGLRLGQHLVKLAGWNLGENCWYPLPYPMADVGIMCK